MWGEGERSMANNPINEQVKRLEELRQKNSFSAPDVLMPIEQALALAYIAKELRDRK
jgi:hypothetical protein